VLEVALADGLRTNERLPVVFGQLQETETRAAAHDWIEQHFDALVARVGNELGAQLHPLEWRLLQHRALGTRAALLRAARSP
jgi:hypothetical protein